ncbi:hypothetical protein [Priestia megaterium]|uniref:hypothetical protein n=1 Tax=Priestia megaterium TaxID=1404 RepID=UPI000BFBE26C|nr:hypothetical protein [Priestia megaterium]PGQ88233.1 hypothetical protein COA18_04720 [Priestia megaterium]
MNQLTLRKEFDFLTKSTTDNVCRVDEFIMDKYEKAMEDQTNYADVMQQTALPTRFMLLQTAWQDFEWYFMQYVINGYGGAQGEETRERIEDGEDADEIMSEWEISKDSLISFNQYFSDDQYERVYFKEIIRALDVYNLSYFKDTGTAGVFSNPEIVKPTDLVNPPIAEVW